MIKNFYSKKKTMIPFLFILIIIVIQAIPGEQPKNSTINNDQSNDFIALFQWTFITLALFFFYLLVVRWHRKKQKTTPPILAPSSNHHKRKEPIHSCKRCGRTGTKQQLPWYQSQQTGEIICQNCYEKRKIP